MKPYEAIIIFNQKVAEDKIDSNLAKFEKKIKESGGSDINIAKWGVRKLASSMKKAKNSLEGFYVMITFNGEGKTPNELKSTLNISEDIIRYSVVNANPAASEAKEEKVEIEPSMIIQGSPEQGTAGDTIK